MNQPTGKDYRNFVKDKCLIFLDLIRERSGDKADFPAGEIAHRTDTKYNSIRTLLKRWSQKPFPYTLPSGKVIQRKGMGLVKEVDERRWFLAYRWGYQITQKGMDYLEYAKLHHKYYPLAEDTVIRRSSDRIYWYDTETGKRFMFVIRPPFDNALDFGQVDVNKLDENQTHPIDGNTWLYARDGIEHAFLGAEGSSRKPSEEFRAYVWAETERIKGEWLIEHPIYPPSKSTSLPPIVERDKDGKIQQYRINPKTDADAVENRLKDLHKYHINPANLDAVEKELEDIQKQSPPDNQEP